MFSYGAKHNTYTSQYDDDEFTMKRLMTSTVILIGAGVIAVVGLGVLAGFLLVNAAAKGLGQELGGHIA